MKIDEEKLNKAKKLAQFAKNKDLATFQELMDIGEKVTAILNKPDLEIPPFPEIPETVIPDNVKVNNLPDVQQVEILNLPEKEEVDFSETNNLLQMIVDKLGKEEDINITLKLV